MADSDVNATDSFLHRKFSQKRERLRTTLKYFQDEKLLFISPFNPFPISPKLYLPQLDDLDQYNF